MTSDLLRAAAEGRYAMSESEREWCDGSADLAESRAGLARYEAGTDPNYARQERWREAEAEHRASAALYRSALAGDTARREREAAALRAEYEHGQRDEREAMQAQLDTMAANAERGRQFADAALARAVEREREACAKECDEYALARDTELEAELDELKAETFNWTSGRASGARDCATMLRARGAKGGE